MLKAISPRLASGRAAMLLAAPLALTGGAAQALSVFDASVDLTVSVASATAGGQPVELTVFDVSDGAPAALPAFTLHAAGAASAAASPVEDGENFLTAFGIAYGEAGATGPDATVILNYAATLSAMTSVDDPALEAAVAHADLRLTLDASPAGGGVSNLPFALDVGSGGVPSLSETYSGTLGPVTLSPGAFFVLDVEGLASGHADSAVPEGPGAVVPLPATGLLLTAALAVLGMRRRRG